MSLAIPGQSTPTKTGWHLVGFQNGDTAIVRWNGHNWVWGSLTAPDSPVSGFTYLGSTVEDVLSSGRFSQALDGLPTKISTELISAADHGLFGLKGQPVLFDSNANPVGNSGTTGSEANPVNVIPSPIDPNVGNSNLSLGSIFGFLGSVQFWKGIGLVLAGAGVLIFAALEFRKL